MRISRVLIALACLAGTSACDPVLRLTIRNQCGAFLTVDVRDSDQLDQEAIDPFTVGPHSTTSREIQDRNADPPFALLLLDGPRAGERITSETAELTIPTSACPPVAATAVKPYVQPVSGQYATQPLLSVGDVVPESSDPTREYRMVGIPDGLGAHPNGDGTSTLFMSHEFDRSTVSEPLVDGPRYRGAYVSKWTLDADGDPISGERAFDQVFMGDTLIGAAAEVGNETSPFADFCSASLAGPPHGFDRWIYLANEEEDAPATFDGMGGLTVAIVDNEAHALPDLGRFSKENTLVQPNASERTLMFSLEDGPSTLDNQLYMYVGQKYASADSVLARNGLLDGKLYVLRSLDPTMNSERTITTGSVTGAWIEIEDADAMTGAELESASDAANAMTFVRLEDGAFNPNDPNEFFFVTTGGSSDDADGVNELGRLYSLRLDSRDPLAPATLTVVYNADQVIADGREIAINPDNIDASAEFLMISEDPTPEGVGVLDARERDGSIWRFDVVDGDVGVDASTATRVAELDPPGRDGTSVAPGVWETSGIIDSGTLFGDDTWLFDVQAHEPTAAPAPFTVEDGQLFLMRPIG